ncbi:MAG TPA: histidine kinase [Rubrobacteraceae bacterium]|nr:histidine kinase [Rubrobacteraceae bacterium]
MSRAGGPPPVLAATLAEEVMGSEAATPDTPRAPIAARVGGRVLAGISLVLFVLSIPARYMELVETARRASTQLGPGLGSLQSFLSEGTYYAIAVLFLEILFVLSLTLISIAIAWRNKPDWPSLFFSTVFVAYAVWVTQTLDALVLPSVLQVIANLTQAAGVLLAVTFFLIFPDGRFVPGWTRASAVAWFFYCLAWGIFPTAWFSLIDPFEASFAAFLILLLLGWGLGLMAQAVRYRRADQRQRIMTKWVILIVAGACIGYGAVYLPDVLLPESGSARALYDLFGVPVFWLLALPMPVAFGIAMQRYHLFKADLIINRALVYGTLTACVIGIYAFVVGYLGALLHTEDSFLISLVATSLVAVLFQPLRDRLQRAINRLMYGERDNPYAALSRLGQHLEATLAPDAVLSTVVKTVAEALKAPYAAIEIERNGSYESAAATGEPVDTPLRLPLVYGGERVGRLVLGRRAGEAEFSPADHRLLDDLARQVSLAVHATRLTEDALRLSEDLQKSREQLVTAREEERRRLRRDLHDGLGPQLASLTMKAEAARDLLETSPERSGALLEQITSQTQEAVTDVRRLVYGLRPPALDELGLLGALQAQAAHGDHNGLRVRVEAPEELPPLPAAVEVAAYRIVQEAVTNVIRHAGARNCVVRIAPEAEALRVEVVDDGRGISEDRSAGVGLHSMRERAEELGGSCKVGAAPSGGTSVRAVLPLARGARARQAVEPEVIGKP